jgi:hypothetical protein
MKKLIFIQLVFIAVHFSGTAQNTRFGFMAGATSANYKIKSDGSTESQNSKIGIIAGLMADIPISKNFSFQPAANFVQKGTKSEYTYNGVTEKSSATVSCIEVPFNFLYNVPGNTGNFFIGAGPSFAFAISGIGKSDDGSNSTSENLKIGNSEDDDIRELTWGQNFTTGYCFKKGFLLSLNYNLGMSNMIPGETNGDKLKSSYFGLNWVFY